MKEHRKKNKEQVTRRELSALLFVIFFLVGSFVLSQPKITVAETGSETGSGAQTAAPPTSAPAPVKTTPPETTSIPIATVKPTVISPAPEAPQTSNVPVCRINNSTSNIQKVIAGIIYNGKKISLNKTPLIKYRGVVMVPINPVFVKKGPKVDCEYNSEISHVRLIRQNQVVTFNVGTSSLYSCGQRISLPAPTVNAVYTATGQTEMLAPLSQLCKALGITCRWDAKKAVYVLKGKKPVFGGKKIYTRYAYSRKAFAKKEYNAVKRVPYKTYLRLVTPSMDTTSNFKFLRVDRYRAVDDARFKRYYQHLIEDYCHQVGISPRKSSLYNKSRVFLNAAKKYKIDPVYLVSQTFLESAYGTSKLASGNVIKKIAHRSFARKKNGKFKTKKLKTRVKVYNLYGIKAYDADPFVGGTSYAYYHKWTSVDRAIYGAASYLNSNYLRGSFHQNTLFKMRFTFRRNIWHQYATSPEYAENIGQRMFWMSTCYKKGNTYLYDFPKYK